MGRYDNLPDGCSYEDLPGWDDVEMFVDQYCENCDLESTIEIVTDKSGEYEWDCPKCKETYRGSLD